MNDKWIEFAIRIQSIAQAGLRYGKDQYDKERYEELREIAAEMLSLKTDIPVNKVFDLFCGESGYRLRLDRKERILRRRDGKNRCRLLCFTKPTDREADHGRSSCQSDGKAV